MTTTPIFLYHANVSHLSRAKAIWWQELITKSKQAIENGYKVIGITASGINKQVEVKDQFGFEFDFYTCDETALKTIIRSNPGALEIKSGTIVNKWHYNDFNKIKFD